MNTEKVAGVGGVFLKAENPSTLAQWYQDFLGIPFEKNPEECCFYCDFPSRNFENPSRQQRTVFAIFPATDSGPTRNITVNLWVNDLDKMVAQLRASGVTVEKVEQYDYGKFAWVTDPAGHRIELFQDTAKS